MTITRDITVSPAGILPIKERFVSTVGYPAQNTVAGEYWCQGRRWIQFFTDVVDPKFTWGNWYMPTTGEAVTGGILEMTAALETTAGVITSKVAGTAAAGANLEIIIPGTYKKNTWYAIRYWAHFTNGFLFRGAHPTGNVKNDTFAYGNTALADNTEGGAYSGAGGSPHFAFDPVAITARSRVRCVGIIGDSRDSGTVADTQVKTDVRELYGPWERAFANAGIPFSNYSRPSERALDFTTAGTRRAALVNRYADDVINGYGINDIAAGTAAATVFTRLETINALFPNLRVWMRTIETITASTDSWATVANQTLNGNNAARVALNTSIRLSNKLAGVIDLAKMVEDELVADKFRVLPGPVAVTNDGTHLNSYGVIYQAERIPVNLWK